MHNRLVWLNVIEQALSDAVSSGEGSGHDSAATHKQKREAISWLLSDGRDLQLVCWLAGVEVNDVRKAYSNLLASGLTFVEWKAHNMVGGIVYDCERGQRVKK